MRRLFAQGHNTHDGADVGRSSVPAGRAKNLAMARAAAKANAPLRPELIIGPRCPSAPTRGALLRWMHHEDGHRVGGIGRSRQRAPRGPTKIIAIARSSTVLNPAFLQPTLRQAAWQCRAL